MGDHTRQDALRKDRFDQEERRQEVRDDVFEASDGEADDLGSQDERRKEGRHAPDLDALRDDQDDEE